MKLYTLKQTTIICPKCDLVFCTAQIDKSPKMTRDSRVEADLHRVMPDATIRAALLATCPECIYTWWLTAFAPHYMLPEMVPDAPPVSNDKKFAHAVLSGRKNGAHSLDRAIVALNGYWCAREDFQPAEKWLDLAAKELHEALADESWFGNRSRYRFIMGEVLRLMGDFHGAVRFFGLVDRRSGLPYQLVEHQVQVAKQGHSKPILLPPHIVEEIFLPVPQAKEAAPAPMVAPQQQSVRLGGMA